MRDLWALLRDQRPTLVMARRQAAVTGELRVESIAGVAAALFNSSAWRANPSANAHEQRQSSPATIAARAAPMPSDLMVPKQQAGAAGHARWDPDLIEIGEIKKSRSVRESTRKARASAPGTSPAKAPRRVKLKVCCTRTVSKAEAQSTVLTRSAIDSRAVSGRSMRGQSWWLQS